MGTSRSVLQGSSSRWSRVASQNGAGLVGRRRLDHLGPGDVVDAHRVSSVPSTTVPIMKKPKDTDEQFLYKARKKAIGPFKGQLWGLPPEVRATIGATLEEQFAFLMSKLKIPGTSAVVAKFVTPATALPSLENARLAAAGKITSEERKAEGLAD